MYLHLLTLIFAAGKVFGYLTWSWWLVFLPSIIAAGIGLLLLLIGFVIVYKTEG